MLRLGVYDDHDKLLGQRVLPLEAIQCGYRHINLRTEGNFTLPLSMLFCLIELDTYIPNDMEAFTDALVNPQSCTSRHCQIGRSDSLQIEPALGMQNKQLADLSNNMGTAGNDAPGTADTEEGKIKRPTLDRAIGMDKIPIPSNIIDFVLRALIDIQCYFITLSI